MNELFKDATFWTISSTTIVSMAVAYFAYWLTGKPRVIMFSPDSSTFELPPQEPGKPPFIVRSGLIVVQNSGRRSATNLQLISAPGPTPLAYSIMPRVTHEVRMSAKSEWILEIPYLAPRETVNVQILNGPTIDSVRFSEGVIKYVPVAYQRRFPTWFNFTAFALMMLGTFTLLYAIAYQIISLDLR